MLEESSAFELRPTGIAGSARPHRRVSTVGRGATRRLSIARLKRRVVTGPTIARRGNERCCVFGAMVAPRMNPPRHDTPAPPPSSDVVVPLRPKPPAYPAVSSPTRPVIIEQDVIDYLVKVPLEQRWRILSRVAMATASEEHVPPPPASAPPPPAAEQHSPSPPPPSMRPPMVVVPAPKAGAGAPRRPRTPRAAAEAA
jgi:hypothetical protein